MIALGLYGLTIVSRKRKPDINNSILTTAINLVDMDGMGVPAARRVPA